MHITPKRQNAAVTICASNYLAKALVLRESYLEWHPDSDFYVLIVDKKNESLVAKRADVSFLWVEELGIEEFVHYAFKFDIVELNTNVKPTVLKGLLKCYETVVYIDPDVRVYSNFRPVAEGLKCHSIVVTPHALTPVLDGKNPSDLDFSRFGSFNLGFVGVSRCEEAFRFLDWWSERCLELGYYEPQVGLAVDQKWMDLAPCYFPNLKILRDPGLNVAYWNLHERQLTRVGGRWLVNEGAPLYFFHFSSFMTEVPHGIAHKQSRFAVGSRPDLHELLDDYAGCLRAQENETYSACVYSYDFFADGTYISPALRRIYANMEMRFPREENPFSPASRLYRFAFRNHLASRGYGPMRRYTFRDMGGFSGATRLIRIALRVLLRIFGPNRYFALMKYLAYISSIRNQGDLFQTVD